MKFYILIFLTVFVLNTDIKAQHEIGASIGASNLLGDFGGGVGNGSMFVKDIDIKSFRPAFGVFYRYNFFKVLALRGQFLYGRLYGNDEYSENEFRYARGLITKSPVLDLTAQVEVNFIPIQYCRNKIGFTPYIAAGIGFAKVNPNMSTVNGEAIPVALEDYTFIGDNSDKTAITVPLAVGVKFVTKKNVVLALETSHRVVVKDNLDNYFRQENDQYFFVNAMVSYVFCKGKGFKDRASKCFEF